MYVRVITPGRSFEHGRLDGRLRYIANRIVNVYSTWFMTFKFIIINSRILKQFIIWFNESDVRCLSISPLKPPLGVIWKWFQVLKTCSHPGNIWYVSTSPSSKIRSYFGPCANEYFSDVHFCRGRWNDINNAPLVINVWQWMYVVELARHVRISNA